jgi:putative transposase
MVPSYVPLARIAAEAAVSLRTAQRWVRRYRECGLAGLVRTGRTDRGRRRRLHDELRQLAEGLALQRPPLGPTAIHRELCRVADARGYTARLDFPPCIASSVISRRL